MRRRRLRPVLPATLALVLSACAQIHTLPTLPDHDGWCRGVGYDGVLRGDPGDPRIAWGEGTTDGGSVIRQDLVWPTGYTARFTPELEILDASRQVRLVAGDVIGGGCVTGPNAAGPLYVIEE